MKHKFGEKEAADSMQAAASRPGVPLELVKRCKRQGNRAFRVGACTYESCPKRSQSSIRQTVFRLTFRRASNLNLKQSKRFGDLL